MRIAQLYNPFTVIERLAVKIARYKRKRKLKGTPGRRLKLGHIDSLELLELVSRYTNKSVRSIFDIGANVGTWTLLAKSIFPDAAIHAFEPLERHISKFKLNCQELDHISIHELCLGNERGTKTIHVSSYSDSSSLLEATALEYEVFRIRQVSEASVRVETASHVIYEEDIPVPDLIKIDVQGYELEVLKGFGDLLGSVKFIICEVSFKEYYKDQPLFLDITNYLNGNGFEIAAFGHNTPRSAELSQTDVLYKHKV